MTEQIITVRVMALLAEKIISKTKHKKTGDVTHKPLLLYVTHKPMLYDFDSEYLIEVNKNLSLSKTLSTQVPYK
jgi:hypothetical protein